MENVMHVNLNKLVSFMFNLKHKIDNEIKYGNIINSDDCINYIRDIVSKNNGTFTYTTENALNDLVDQIFFFYYGSSDIIDLPILESYKKLSKLN